MFNNFPIKIETKHMKEDAFCEQINKIKELSKVGFKLDLFFEILINAHNGTSNQQKNSFTLAGWQEHFLNNKIKVSSEQIQLLFTYLMKYHQGMINTDTKKYALQKSPEKDNFMLEFVVFKSVE